MMDLGQGGRVFEWGTAFVQMLSVLFMLFSIIGFILFVKMVINTEKMVKSLQNIENSLSEKDDELQKRS